MIDAFERGWVNAPVSRVGEAMRVGDAVVMYAWERPLMRAFAQALSGPERDLLEIGYGMGVFAECVAEAGVRRHVVVEAHPQIAAEARAWAGARSGTTVIEGFWQETVAALGSRFDAVFYDSFSPPERLEDDLLAIARIAVRDLLRPGGRFGFWTAQPAVGARLQRELLRLYSRLELRLVGDLVLDPQAREAGLADAMLVPVCVV